MIDSDFQELENPTEVEGMATPAPPIENPAPSKLDKIADFIGAYAAAIILTFVAAVGLAFTFTIIPTIVFSFSLVIRCWAGIWSLMLIRGALKNKTG